MVHVISTSKTNPFFPVAVFDTSWPRSCNWIVNEGIEKVTCRMKVTTIIFLEWHVIYFCSWLWISLQDVVCGWFHWVLSFLMITPGSQHSFRDSYSREIVKINLLFLFDFSLNECLESDPSPSELFYAAVTRHRLKTHPVLLFWSSFDYDKLYKLLWSLPFL